MKSYIIIEDEHNAATRLQRLIATLQPQLQCVGTAASIADAIPLIASNKQADLVFMDIELADGSSFEIFNRTTVDIPVIFTTAYDQYALEAFKNNGYDYLLKPVKIDDLQRALQKIDALKNKFQQSDVNQNQNYTSSFLIKLGHKLIQLSTEEIVCFYVDSRVVCALTTEGKELPMSQTLEKLQEELDPSLFFRINRKMLVHKKAIAHIQTASRSRLLLQFAVTCPIEALVATEKVSTFKQWMQL